MTTVTVESLLLVAVVNVAIAATVTTAVTVASTAKQ